MYQMDVKSDFLNGDFPIWLLFNTKFLKSQLIIGIVQSIISYLNYLYHDSIYESSDDFLEAFSRVYVCGLFLCVCFLHFFDLIFHDSVFNFFFLR